MSKILIFPHISNERTASTQSYELVTEHTQLLLECLEKLQEHVSKIEEAALHLGFETGPPE